MNKLPRGFGLVSATLVWVALTAGVLFGPPRGAGGRARAGAGAPAGAQGPPLERTLWDRVTAAPRLLFGRHETPEVALAHALDRLGAPAWHQAGHQGLGVKVAILDSGFR